jgi:hypothetical protein
MTVVVVSKVNIAKVMTRRPAYAVHKYNDDLPSYRQFNLPFDQTGFLYGGPTLKTTAIKIYWKQESKNRTVFS